MSFLRATKYISAEPGTNPLDEPLLQRTSRGKSWTAILLPLFLMAVCLSTGFALWKGSQGKADAKNVESTAAAATVAALRRASLTPTPTSSPLPTLFLAGMVQDKATSTPRPSNTQQPPQVVTAIITQVVTRNNNVNIPFPIYVTKVVYQTVQATQLVTHIVTGSPYPTHTPYPTLTPADPYPTYTPYPTLTPADPYPTFTEQPTYTPYPTLEPYPTHTDYPTYTPEPTQTPWILLIEVTPTFTNTPEPTATETPTPEGGITDGGL